MRLEPGYYKVEHRRGWEKSFHLLEIRVKDGKKYARLDHSSLSEINEDEERWFTQDYQLIKKYTKNNPATFSDVQVIIHFYAENTPLKFKVRSHAALLNVFRMFPRLFKKFSGK